MPTFPDCRATPRLLAVRVKGPSEGKPWHPVPCYRRNLRPSASCCGQCDALEPALTWVCWSPPPAARGPDALGPRSLWGQDPGRIQVTRSVAYPHSNRKQTKTPLSLSWALQKVQDLEPLVRKSKTQAGARGGECFLA